MTLHFAIFGIENDGVNLAINLLILFLVVVYLALIAYTYLDAKRRLEDPVLVGCATVASLFPFVGVIVYSILRPPEFLEDRRERELEIRASELRVRQLEENSCPNCEHPVERTYLRCPNCRARIKDPCESCGKPVDPRWSLCPYCETPTRARRTRAGVVVSPHGTSHRLAAHPGDPARLALLVGRNRRDRCFHPLLEAHHQGLQAGGQAGFTQCQPAATAPRKAEQRQLDVPHADPRQA